MKPDCKTPSDRDGVLEAFAAELTIAAYRVALRTGTRGSWLDLQLDLWRALTDTVTRWEKEGNKSSDNSVENSVGPRRPLWTGSR
jgi:hypothetical protein